MQTLLKSINAMSFLSPKRLHLKRLTKLFSKLIGKRQHFVIGHHRCHHFVTPLPENHVKKGKPSGVCLCSKLPFRPCRNIFDSKWIASTRVIHSIVKAGHLHIQVITIYCKPTSSVASVAFNQDLLNYVITRADLVPLPFIILGDSNMDLDRFDCWPSLENQRVADVCHRCIADLLVHLCLQLHFVNMGAFSYQGAGAKSHGYPYSSSCTF